MKSSGAFQRRSRAVRPARARVRARLSSGQTPGIKETGEDLEQRLPMRRRLLKPRSVKSLKSIEERQEDPELRQICFKYLTWVNDDTFTVFQTEKGELRQFLSPKRGNIAYFRRLEHRFDLPKSILKTLRYSEEFTSLLFITLTFRRKCIFDESCQCVTRDRSWYQSGRYFNSYITNMRRTFKTPFNVVRCFETQRDGYAHIHALIWTPSKTWDIFKYNGKYRLKDITLVDKIKRKWKYGFSDIQCFINGKFASNYILKYITKFEAKDEAPYYNTVTHHHSKACLNFAFQWLYKKRSFSVSRYFRILQLHGVDSTRGQLHISKFLGGSGGVSPPSLWVFLGINSKSRGFVPKEHFPNYLRARSREVMKRIASEIAYNYALRKFIYNCFTFYTGRCDWTVGNRYAGESGIR